MFQIRASLLLSMLLLLNACSSFQLGERPLNSLYCDNFLIYRMCAQDMNQDGVVEFVYFEDDNDVFMYREGAENTIPNELGMHRCARPMDEELVATTSRVFFVDDETPYLEKQDIRGAMMIKYIAYLPEVTACNLRAEQDAQAGDSGS